MASITWEPDFGGVVFYGDLIEESIFSARAIYQDSDGDDYSPKGTYTYTFSGASSGTLVAGTKLVAGNYTLTVVFDPEDSGLGSNISTTASLTVEKATPVVIWNNPPDIRYTYDGSSGPKLSDEQLNAVANIAGTFEYSPAKDTELNAGAQIVTATFTPSDTDNYQSLPFGELLQIEFEVLKGDIHIDWDMVRNGVSRIKLLEGGGEEVTPYILDFEDDSIKAFSLGNEVSGSFSFSPSKGTALTDSTEITATFTPNDVSNWNEATLILPFTVYKSYFGPEEAPTMFGCYVQGVSASVGWGGSSTTCDLTLVEESLNEEEKTEGAFGHWQPPPIGTPCYFKYRGFEFGGVFTRWSYAEATGGRTYKVLLESPGKLLDGVQIIMDGFEGTAYNVGEIPDSDLNRRDGIVGMKYNRFNPSTNPNITTNVNNIYNALGHFENYSFEFDGEESLFGRADTNSAGFLANKLLETIELLSCPEENEDAAFAHKCAFGEKPNPDFNSNSPEDIVDNRRTTPIEYFKIDLSEIKDISPNHYRISGTTQNLNGIISDVAELTQHDYFVTLEPDVNQGELEKPVGFIVAEGASPVRTFKNAPWNGGGEILNPNIKIKAINKGGQPDPGAIRSLVDGFKENGVVMSSSIGQELQDDTTQKLVLGGQATRMVTSSIFQAFPIYGKLQNNTYIFDPLLQTTAASYNPRNIVPIVLDPTTGASAGVYGASIFELRMATAGQNAWQTFKVFESVAKDEYANSRLAPWCVDIDIDPTTLSVLAAGNRGASILGSTSKTTAQKGFSAQASQLTSTIFSAVENVAKNFYGRMFALPMPVEPGGIENNIRFITEDQTFETTWEAVDSAFDDANRFRDVSFFDSSGKTKSYAEWRYDPSRDFSSLGSDYAVYSGGAFDLDDNFFQQDLGIASTGMSIEKTAIFFQDIFGPTPFVIVNAGNQIRQYDGITTPDLGLSFLANYFFGIEIDPRNYIGPGKANVQIPIPPDIVPPKSFGIAQQSNRYVWGPWYGGDLAGKTEVIQEQSLVPESFGGIAGLNESGFNMATVGNAQMAGSETGYVELAEFPSYNIAERFAGSGPYVSDMSFTIDTGGFKTTYKFNTWTPQFGKLAKYNIDRIARINKASLALAQRERSKVTRKPFLPPAQRGLSGEALVKRMNRPDVSLNLGQIFPPQGDLDGTWAVSDISTSDLGSFAEEGKTYQQIAGASKDNNMIPFHTSKSKSKNSNMPSLENPTSDGEPDGMFADSKALDPYFSTKVNGDDGSATFKRVTTDGLVVDPTPDDFSPDKMTNKGAVTAVRGMCQTFPMIAAGWGYDVAFNPVPGNGTNFDPEFQKDPALRKAGPVRLLWDDERKIWAGGPEVACGKLASDITAPSSPSEATTFTIDVFRKTTEPGKKGSGALSTQGTLTVYNRDPSLSQEKQDKDTFIMVIRVNYEWMPLWVGCPDSESSS